MKELGQTISRALAARGVTRVREQVSLSELTSFRIGGPAAACAEAGDGRELAAALDVCRENGFPFCVLGNGTNVLAPDEGYAGLVLRLAGGAPRFEGRSATVAAGTSLSAFAKACVARGLAGLEALSGIPGTVGGACAMNAGAYGAQLSDVLVSVRILRGGVVEEAAVREGDLGYRSSAFAAPGCIVLEATVRLDEDDGGAVQRMEAYTRARREKQPLALPSAGSVFRRPPGHFAGALIEQCGLKGARVGGAEVSELHAGFIVNRGGATCADVLALIRHVQTVVFERTGVRLEREIKLFSEL